MASERREAPRTAIAIPVEFEGRTGVTRDVSAGGVYFTASRPQLVPTSFNFTLIFFGDAGPEATRVSCRGRVIRVDVDESGTTIGIAAAIEAFGADEFGLSDAAVSSVEH